MGSYELIATPIDDPWHHLVTYISPCDNVTGHAKYPSRQCDWLPGFLSELIIAGRPCGPIYFGGELENVVCGCFDDRLRIQQRCWINNYILFTLYKIQPFVDEMLDSLPREFLRAVFSHVCTSKRLGRG